MRFYNNRSDKSRVRWYRVPDGTPALPIPHSFTHTTWLPESWLPNPGEPGCDVGEFKGMRKYDKGALPIGWRPPTKFIGTPEQWLNGSVYPTDQPLAWDGEFSLACKPTDHPQGRACATCRYCGHRISAVWNMEPFPDFASLSVQPLIWRSECVFNNQCVVEPDICPVPTAAAWELEGVEGIPGMSGGIVTYQGSGKWSTCCKDIAF